MPDKRSPAREAILPERGLRLPTERGGDVHLLVQTTTVHIEAQITTRRRLLTQKTNNLSFTGMRYLAALQARCDV